MTERSAEAVIPPAEGTTIDSDEFAALFDAAAIGDCFHVVGGFIAAPGETEAVEVSTYAAKASDFIDIGGPKHREHFEAAEGASKAAVVLEIPKDDRYAFDSGMPEFRMGRGNFLIAGREIPVRVMVLGPLGGPLDFWLVKEKRQRK